MREAKDIELNTRAEAVGGINNEITNIRKYIERDQENSGTAGAALAPTKVKGRRIASGLDRLREWYKGANTDWRAAINRDEAMELK